MDNQVIDRLKKARETISTPDTWLQGDMAKDSKGKCVNANGKHAVSFCLAGAYLRYHKEDEDSATTQRCRMALINTLKLRGYTGLETSAVVFNDSHTHEEVLAFIDETIERLQNE